MFAKSGSRVSPATLSGNLSVLCNDAILNTADLLPHLLATAPTCHSAVCGCEHSSHWAGKRDREGIRQDISSCSTDLTRGGREAGRKGVGKIVEKLFHKPFSPITFRFASFLLELPAAPPGPCLKPCSKARACCRRRPRPQLQLKQHGCQLKPWLEEGTPASAEAPVTSSIFKHV